MSDAAAISKVRLLTGATADTFADEEVQSFLDDHVIGDGYNTKAAAADLLEAWAASLSVAFDFDADGSSFRRSQQATALREAAKDLRKRQGIRIHQIVRSDERSVSTELPQ